MSLASGTRLGAYEITAQIGAGGMGEVYRATDTHLKRAVAIKVLPASVAGDADRLARFQREAEALAALNHPNIAAIYGLEKTPHFTALVMELVEGDDLSQRIARRAISIDEALPIAKQIAEALEAAHEQGIIHRDLKPANIKVRTDGTVKVLDFGLAKAMDPAATASVAAMNSPTLSLHATQAGMILGTAAYMAPEQAKGKAVDRRADIWAFGAVLFEMLTGRRAFIGEDVTDTIVAVMSREPEWTRLPADTPAPIRRLLRRSLEKDRRKRLADASDARLDIEEALNPRTAEAANEAASAAPPVMWIAASGVLGLALAALTVVHVREPRTTALPATPQFEFTLAPAAGRPFPSVADAASTPRVSPDGQWVLIGTELRRLDASMSQALDVQSSGSRSFWAPDSKWVAMFVGTRDVMKVRVPDGTAQKIGTLPGPSRGGGWAASGALLVTSYSTLDEATLRVWLPGDADFAPVKVPGLESRSIYLPEFLDGGPDFLFLARDSASGEGHIYLATLRGRDVVNLVQLMTNATAAHYTPAAGGRLLFVRGDTLYAQRFDLGRRTLDGDPELVRKGVATSPVFGMAAFSVSRDGVLVWRSGTAAGAFVTTFDREGRTLGTSGPIANPSHIRVSPDETHAVVYGEDVGSRLLEIGQSGSLNLGGGIRAPLWMPGGTRLLYEDDTRKGWFEGPPARSGDVRARPRPGDVRRLDDVSADGQTALYSTLTGAVFATRLDGAHTQPTAVADTGAPIYGPRFSPDGRWVVYAEAKGTQINAFVQPSGGGGARRQIASDARHVVWRGDGQEILFISTFEGQAWVASVQVSGSGADLRFSESKRLFAVRQGPGIVIGATPLEVSRDGSRIFYPQAVDTPEESKVIQVSTSWMKW